MVIYLAVICEAGLLRVGTTFARLIAQSETITFQRPRWQYRSPVEMRALIGGLIAAARARCSPPHRPYRPDTVHSIPPTQQPVRWESNLSLTWTGNRVELMVTRFRRERTDAASILTANAFDFSEKGFTLFIVNDFLSYLDIDMFLIF